MRLPPISAKRWIKQLIDLQTTAILLLIWNTDVTVCIWSPDPEECKLPEVHFIVFTAASLGTNPFCLSLIISTFLLVIFLRSAKSM